MMFLLVLAIVTVAVVIASAKAKSVPQAVGNSLGILAIIVVAYFAVRWAYSEYYIATHCTMVLGTRVCQ